ncbi:hypothetical protein [Amycolatopsis cihanbeyliensis]|uniref:Uncharacterized protein n=1 Tax=Amycolatopsis cihanbeyliensis TaxID=1128664 RepID=A0A542DQ73_AMYCI|nr:hypothetical protein [Amycolatopsis cihanbeyliensis]TQJ05261.1 hypothetical protein FB471_5089 [Amycolatopsis cihanbeyliensis]
MSEQIAVGKVRRPDGCPQVERGPGGGLADPLAPGMVTGGED